MLSLFSLSRLLTNSNEDSNSLWLGLFLYLFVRCKYPVEGELSVEGVERVWLLLYLRNGAGSRYTVNDEDDDGGRDGEWGCVSHLITIHSCNKPS